MHHILPVLAYIFTWGVIISGIYGTVRLISWAWHKGRR